MKIKGSFISGAIEKILNLDFVKVYLGDVGVRHNVYVLRSLVSGILYSAFNMFAAILYNSRWFAAVSVYYILLATTRYILYLTGRKHGWCDTVSLSLYKNCRAVGVVMLFLNVAMATMIVYTVLTSRAQNHSALVIYLLAIYSIFVFVFNTASVFFTRKKRLPYSYIIARIISFCASFMSVFNFVNSLIYKLEINAKNAKIINGTVGGLVIISVLFLCICIIYKCTKRISEYKEKE